MKNIIEQLLEFENKNDILKYKFTDSDLMMWPYIRNLLFQNLWFSHCGYPITGDIEISERFKSTTLIDKYRYILEIVKDLFKGVKKADILFIAIDPDNEKTSDGKYRNPIHDVFAGVYPRDSYVLEKSRNFEFKRPKQFSGIGTYDYILIYSKILAKVTKVSKCDLEQIQRLLNVIKEGCPMPVSTDLYDLLRARLIRVSKELKHHQKMWKKLLDKINPKVVFLDCAAYGTNAHILHEANKRGVICCEIQHGVINNQHIAYINGSRLTNNIEYCTYLPKYILTFGDYWNQYIKGYYIPITIGRTFVQKVIHNHDNEGKKRILFIGNLYFYKEIFNIIKQLVKDKKAEKYNIIIRPHPSDIKNIFLMNKYKDFGEKYGILIQLNSLDEALMQADVVVSEASTVVFEAYAYNKKIIIKNSTASNLFIPSDLGYRYDTFGDFIKILEGEFESSNCNIDIKSIFATNWRENYIAFIKNVCDLKTSNIS